MENQFTASVVAGAIVNLVVNLLLIPKLGALGAVIGTLVAELVACLWQYRSLRGKVEYLKSVLTGMVYFTIGVLMYCGVRFIAGYIETTLLFRVIIEVVLGVILYCTLCLLYWKTSKNNAEFKMIESIIRK